MYGSPRECPSGGNRTNKKGLTLVQKSLIYIQFEICSDSRSLYASISFDRSGTDAVKTYSEISLSDQQREDLELTIRKRKSVQSLVLRAQIILAGAEGKSLSGTSRELGCTRETVTRWGKHWVERSDELSIQDRLKEAPRPGAPPRFTAVQVYQIAAMACDKTGRAWLPPEPLVGEFAGDGRCG